MTDNEIIKALECCVYDDYAKCHYDCPYKTNCRHLSKDALDIIDRQQAEIERLGELLRLKAEGENILNDVIAEQQAELEDLREIVFMDRTEEIKKKNKELKSEAVKEFAEKLKEIATQGFWEANGAYVGVEQIDNLVKEMVGEYDI